MHIDTIKEFKRVADKSVKETIEMFFKFPSGFHGDTGIQHYLYHRILFKAGSKIYWKHPDNPNIQTLLFQSEVYTDCTYKSTGQQPGRGRFDMAFVEPPEDLRNDNIISQNRLKPLIAFEVGRNKGASALGDYEAPKEIADPKPGDATKIIRDLRFKSLYAGYILQFFDKSRISNFKKIQEVAKKLRDFLKKIEPINCHVALSVLNPGEEPKVWIYPESWSEEIRLEYEKLDIDKFDIKTKIKQPPRNLDANRITYEEFLERCGDCGRVLQEALSEKYTKKLKLLYGSKTMTVNEYPKGRLFRVGNKYDKNGERVYQISNQLIEKTTQDFNKLIKYGKIEIPKIKMTNVFH